MWNEDFRAGYEYVQEVKHKAKIARLKQTLLGIAAIAVGALSAVVLEGDITALVLMGIVGMGLIVSTEVFIEP